MSSSLSASRPDRLSRPMLFMAVAELYGQRSSCPRASVGVTAVREGRIIATGYVGAPSGLPHCLDVGCIMVENHCVRSIHAEANLIAWAARVGTSMESTDVYCTHKPCLACAKLLGNAGIDSLYFREDYGDDYGVKLLNDLGIHVRSI